MNIPSIAPVRLKMRYVPIVKDHLEKCACISDGLRLYVPVRLWSLNHGVGEW